MASVIWGADFKSQRLTGLGTGTAQTDAVTLAQLQGALGMVTVKGFDRASWEAALASAPVNGWVYAPPGNHSWTGDIVITTIGLTIWGQGVIQGTFKVGSGAQAVGTKIAIDITFSRLKFNRALDKTTYTTKGYANDSSFIKVDRVRNVEINGCQFYGAAYPVWVLSNVNGGQHEISDLIITGCHFDECDEALHGEFDASSPATWQCFADSKFDDNTINKSYVRMIGVAGVDGLHVSSNIHFMINFNSTGNARFQEKRQNIWIGQSDWLHIADNALFEAGYESIFLDKVRRVTITGGNQFAWPGQVVPSDAVRVVSGSGGAYSAGTWANLTFTGNDGSQYSESLLRVEGDFINIALGPNACYYDPAQSGNAAGRYQGTSETSYTARRATLDALPHYRYDLGAVTGIKAADVNIADGSISRANHYDKLPGHTYTQAVTSLAAGVVNSAAVITPSDFTKGTIQNLMNIRSSSEGSGSYTGKVLITVRSSTGKVAMYEMMIVKTNFGSTPTSIMNYTGLPTPASGANADDPAFMFAVSSGNILQATPQGETIGSYTFTVTTTGDMIAG